MRDLGIRTRYLDIPDTDHFNVIEKLQQKSYILTKVGQRYSVCYCYTIFIAWCSCLIHMTGVTYRSCPLSLITCVLEWLCYVLHTWWPFHMHMNVYVLWHKLYTVSHALEFFGINCIHSGSCRNILTCILWYELYFSSCLFWIVLMCHCLSL